jgi:predicted Zn-dependent protease with MMP-like domain
MPLNISMDEFEKMTSQAIREIPDDFLEALENVDVFVEEEAGPEVLDALGIGFPADLLGLYQGLQPPAHPAAPDHPFPSSDPPDEPKPAGSG